MKTTQQERAAFALERVQGFLKQDEVTQGEIKAHASSLPAMIHMNGLGQAMAFCKSKAPTAKGKSYELLYQLINDWLKMEKKPFDGQQDLMMAITNSTMHEYRLAQAEAQTMMAWVQKFSRAYLKSPEKEKSNGNGATP